MVRIVLAILVAFLAAGCASGPPIGVRQVDASEVHHTLTSNVLSTGEPSSFSLQVLQRTGLTKKFAEDREAALADLHLAARETQYSEGLFALAELSFLTAVDDEDPLWMAAALVYAYAYLFPEAAPGPGAFDPRLRIAADLYNRALTRVLSDDEDSTVVTMAAREVTLPFGSLDIRFDEAQLEWAGSRFVEFINVADFEVIGLEPRYRKPGVGAPLTAGLGAQEVAEDRGRRVSPRARIPASAVVRIALPRASLETGQLTGDLELYTADEDFDIEIGDRRVAVEYEATTALAYMLGSSRVWELGKSGFLSGDFRLFEDQPEDGLMMLYPHKPGRIPVVLVHGTLSSPATWAAMLNELAHDPDIFLNYEFWFYFYNTGNPILYSAERLRRALRDAVSDFDPEGVDPALREMVVIGHSQGGIVTRLAVTEAGNHFWDSATDVPFDEIEVSDETRDLLRRTMLFDPLKSVDSVVFIATPHRGSYVAGWGIARWGARFTSLPRDLTTGIVDALDRNPDAFRIRDVEKLSTSVDNMAPGHPFLLAMAEAPIRPSVHIHSIVAVKGDGPLEEEGDGVVKYTSAHIDWAESERVVRSGHSTLATPATINEVRRILYDRLPDDAATHVGSTR